MRNKKIFWFTGQPGSGKTVLALLLKKHLEEKYNDFVFHIDGDELRTLFNNMKYDKDGRETNITRAQDVAKFVHNNGFDVIVSMVSPFKEIREQFKEDMGMDILEIYVHTSNERGREHFHTEYEEPTHNFFNLDTTDILPKDSLTQLLDLI
jgi:adenylylsulfate kinase